MKEVKILVNIKCIYEGVCHYNNPCNYKKCWDCRYAVLVNQTPVI